ncbi:hypothetical protein DP034_25355 [Escherichia coli O11]|nr:hypothetical protein [Escherichia coli O11]
MRQQQDEPGRFSICSRQAAVVHENTGSVTVTVGIAENTYNHRKWFHFDTCLFITQCAVKPRPSGRGGCQISRSRCWEQCSTTGS